MSAQGPQCLHPLHVVQGLGPLFGRPALPVPGLKRADHEQGVV